MNIDFYKEFININFDAILEECANSLVNSNDMYLQFKQHYLLESRENFIKFQILSTQYNDLKIKKFQQNGTKFNYTEINNSILNDLKIQLKNLITLQRKHLTHFIEYTHSLNKKISEFPIQRHIKLPFKPKTRSLYSKN